VALSREISRALPRSAKVVREGEEQEIPAEEVVMGDILIIQAGERVPADCRILESNHFMVDNSALTGESEPQERDVHCTHDEQLLTANMAFQGTHAVQGTARAVATRTGANTVMGKMMELTENNRNRDTLITRELTTLMHIITGTALTVGSLFFVVAHVVGYFFIDAILFLIGVIVAIVPEGLLATVTVTLSVSVKRLYNRNVVVKNLEAVETLGAVSVIVCDKTGTLTKNKATVAHVWVDNNIGQLDTGGDSTHPAIDFDVTSHTWKSMARAALLCNRAEFSAFGEDGTSREVTGPPLEAALLRTIEGIEGQSGTFRSLHPKVKRMKRFWQNYS